MFADRCVGIELGIERAPNHIQIQQRFAKQREFVWEPDAVLDRDMRKLHDRAADLHVLERRRAAGAELARDDPPYLTLKVLLDKRLLEIDSLADLQSDHCRFITAPITDREHQLQEFFLKSRRKMPDHTEIEKRDTVIVGDKNI